MFNRIKKFFKDLFHVNNMIKSDRYEWIEAGKEAEHVDLSKCFNTMINREIDRRSHSDEFVENVVAAMNETGIDFVTTEMCGIRWIKYYESELHVFWTPIDDVMPITTYSPAAMNRFISWMGERLNWDMLYVKMVLPSHHQAKRITSFFKRNAIPYRNFWQIPSVIGRVFISIEHFVSSKIFKKNQKEPQFGQIRPIIIENKLGDEQNEHSEQDD